MLCNHNKRWIECGDCYFSTKCQHGYYCYDCKICIEEYFNNRRNRNLVLKICNCCNLLEILKSLFNTR